MAEKNNVAMFIQDENGNRVQVGWASPRDGSGVRTFEYSPGYENSRPKDVSFEDDELSQKIAEEQHEARQADGSDGEEFVVEVEAAKSEFDIQIQENEEPLPAEPVTDGPDEELAADPIEDAPDEELADEQTDNTVTEDDVVELDNGGVITEVEGEAEDEEAEFQRLLAEEQAQENQPQTRREARENEDTNE